MLFAAADGGWVTSDGRVATRRAHGVDVVRHGAVDARGSSSTRAGTDAQRRPSGRPRGRGRDRQPRAARRAGPAGRGGHASRGPGSRPRTWRSGSGSSVTCTTVRSSGSWRSPCSCSRPGSTAPTTLLRDEVDRAIAQLGADRAGAARPGRRPAAGRARRWRPARGHRGPRRAGSRCACEVDVVDRRFPPKLESAAWFVVAEAVANAVKHADVERGDDQRRARRAHLRRRGHRRRRRRRGRAGSGLQGLADRVAALGGSLTVARARTARHPGRGGVPVRVVIADDSALLREGLSRLLARVRRRGVRDGG